MTSTKLKYVILVDIKDNKIKGSHLDFDGEVEETVKAMIDGLKKPLYAFVRERLIEPRQPGSAQVRILVSFREKSNGRSIDFTVQ
jgi:hypothetical protein